jgi:peroxiredoxin
MKRRLARQKAPQEVLMFPSPALTQRRSLLRLALGMGLIRQVSPALAQTATPTPAAAPAQLRGPTLDGQAFDLARLRGKVVMVLFWSTDCAVCRDKMPELRANVKGWQGQPFELVSVSTDTSRSAIEAHQRLVQLTIPASQRFTTLWAGERGHEHSFGPTGQLPALFLLDKSGRVVESHHGRVPAQAWDRVADLL